MFQGEILNAQRCSNLVTKSNHSYGKFWSHIGHPENGAVRIDSITSPVDVQFEAMIKSMTDLNNTIIFYTLVLNF